MFLSLNLNLTQGRSNCFSSRSSPHPSRDDYLNFEPSFPERPEDLSRDLSDLERDQSFTFEGLESPSFRCR